MKRVIVFGGMGFIGRSIAEKLYNRGNCQIVCVDKYLRDGFMEVLGDRDRITFVQADLTDRDAYKKFDGEFDEVYVMAAIVGVGNVLKRPSAVIEVNTKIILNVLDWMKSVEGGKMLFASTSECYAGAVERFGYSVPTDELVPLCIENIMHPRFSYAATKILGESASFAFAADYGFNLTVVRYHNVYGPDMGFNHIIPHLNQRFLNGETPFKLYGASQTRAFCYIDDAVEATVLAMESGQSRSEILHIGNPEEISIESLIKYVGKLYEYTGDYVEEETFPGSVSRRCPDISKITKYVGYAPIVDWKEGVSRTVDWYREYLSSSRDVDQGLRVK